MERFYSHFNTSQQTQSNGLDHLDDGRSDNETNNFVNDSTNNSLNSTEQKTNIRGDSGGGGINNCGNNTLQMNTQIFGSGNGSTGGGLYGESFMQGGRSSALAEMENKLAVQSSVFASNMLMPSQIDSNSFNSHHSTIEQVGNTNVNNQAAFQAEMAALCQQQMLQAQIMQAHCFTPVTGIQHYTNSTTNNSLPSNSNNLIYGQSASTSSNNFQQNLVHSPFGLQNYYSQQQQQSLLASNNSPTTASFLLPNVSNIETTNISLNRNTQKQQQNGNQNRFGSGTSISSLYGATANLSSTVTEIDTDPLELQRFADHFKQRRIKLGVTQADVGKALAYLKMAGVGSLSQSTICRFESLTLSHNNMVALKPILQSWLERAEEATRQQAAASAAVEASGGIGGTEGDVITLQCIAAATAAGILPCTEKKRKRTSIAAPEKKLLEEYFKQQNRPTGDRIAAIADKLDLKKNVVRVWFCNQRQKNKRNQFRTNRVGISQISNSSDLDQSQKSPVQQPIHLSHHQLQQNQYQNTLDNNLSCNPTTAALAAAAVAASMQLREQQRQFCHSSLEEQQSREEISEESQIFENQRKISSNSIDDNNNCKLELKKIINKEEQKNQNNASVIQHTPFAASGGGTSMLFRHDNHQLFYQTD